MNFIDPLGLWSIWGGGTVVDAAGPKGANQGGGVAFDSENGGAGLYGTSGSSTGAGLSAGVEVGFYTGAMSGETTISTFGYGIYSVGLIQNFDGDWGIVVGFALGWPVEGTISENITDFMPFFSSDQPCD